MKSYGSVVLSKISSIYFYIVSKKVNSYFFCSTSRHCLR